MANTYVDYTATAGQTDFNFSFPYLENDHVEVFIDGVESTAFTIYGSYWRGNGTSKKKQRSHRRPRRLCKWFYINGI
jgi:hypothetical protein